MNRSTFKLHIPKPCHENWSEMNPVEKGRFCSSCEKQVYDFTTSEKQEIVDFLVEQKSGTACIRVRSKTLDEPTIKPQPFIRPETHFPAYFAVALVLVFGTALFSCERETIGELQSIDAITQPAHELVNEGEISLLDSLLYETPIKPECLKQEPIEYTYENYVTMGIPADDYDREPLELGKVAIQEPEMNQVFYEVPVIEKRKFFDRIRYFFNKNFKKRKLFKSKTS